MKPLIITMALIVLPLTSQELRFDAMELESSPASRPTLGISHIPEAKGGGVSVADVDGDGIPDIVECVPSRVDDVLASRPPPPPRFWRGLGNRRFEEKKSAAWPTLVWPMSAAFDDIDGDGRRDIMWSTVKGLRAWRNLGGFNFEDMSSTWLPESARQAGWCTSMCLADLDLDGDLDMVVARYLAFPWDRPPRDGVDGRVCRYKGRPTICGPRGFAPLQPIAMRRDPRTFSDATSAWRFDQSEAVYGLGIVALDANHDGRPDIAIAADMTPNLLFISDPDGGYHEVGATSGIAFSADGAPEAGMGIDVGDLNRDGLDDLVITNFEGESNSILLQRREGGFTEVSATCGTAPVDRPLLGWGVGLRDFDGDGFTDILIANGHVYPDAATLGSAFAMPMTLHAGGLNEMGKPRFRAVKGRAELSTPHVGRSLAMADFDLDGRWDAVMSRVGAAPIVLHNLCKPVRWIGVRVNGGPANCHGVGATVEIKGHAPTLSGTVRVGGSFLAQSDAAVLFAEPSYGFSPGQVMTVSLGKRSITLPTQLNRYVTVDLP